MALAVTPGQGGGGAVTPTPVVEAAPTGLVVAVKDILMKSAIVGAVVTVDGNQATTDENGNATFPTLTANTYTVSVTALNYFPSTVTFTGSQVEVDLIPYALPISIGILIATGALIIVGAKLAGWW